MGAQDIDAGLPVCFPVICPACQGVHVTSTGKQLIAPQPIRSTWNDGYLALTAVTDPCGTNNSCNIAVTGSLGSAVTVTLPPATY